MVVEVDEVDQSGSKVAFRVGRPELFPDDEMIICAAKLRRK
jgi:hypothetical protein